MKSFLKNFFLIIFLLISSLLYSQTVQWARRGISEGYDYGNAIAVDDSGNAYISGQIEYTANFDGVSLPTNGIHDILAGKYGADGSIKWLRHAGGTGGDVAYGVGVDALHNCYVTGEVEQTATFGGGFSVTSAGSNDIFLAKYDINGSVTRLQKWGSAGNDKGRALAVSPSGECYITGYYSDGMMIGNVSLSHAGGNDVYVTKINSSGTVLWAKRGGGGNDDRGYGVAYDKNGNVYITGYFNSSATFSGTTISNSGVNGAYVAAYDNNGSFKWIRKGGSCCDDAEGNCIAVDEDNYIYVAGYYSGTATFGATTLTAVGSTDIFLAKYDASGNVIWAKSAGGAYEDIAYGLSIDTVNHQIYMTGQIDDYSYFGTNYIGAAGNRDVFITAYDMNGNVDWVRSYGGNQRDIGYAIANDNNGNIFTTGIYNESATFESTVLNGYLLFDFFIEKTSTPAPQPSVQTSNLSISHINCDELNLSFSPGNGTRRIVIARANAPVSATPTDGQQYSASSTFGSGSNLGSGNYVVYNNTGNHFTLTGLTAGTSYYFKIFEYNGTGGTINYLTSSPASSNETIPSLNVTVSAATNEICIGDSILLSAQGATNYSWSPGVSLSSSNSNPVFAFPNTTTIYTAVGSDAFGCQAEGTLTITVNPLPTINFTGPVSVCENSQPILLTNGNPAGGEYSGIGITNNSFDASVAGVGTFAVLYEFTNSNGCSSSAQSSIIVNALPQINFTALPSVCINANPIMLSQASPLGGTYSGAGVVAGTFDPSLAGPGATLIQYEYSDSNGCTSIAHSTINVNPLPAIAFTPVSPICENTLPITLTNANPSGGIYSGQGVSAGVFDPSVGGGLYNINYEFSDSLGCTTDADFQLEVSPLPIVNLGPDSVLCVYNSIVLDPGAGFASYLWSDGSVSSTIIIDSTGTGIGTKTVFVEVTNMYSCSNSDTLNITFDLCAGVNEADIDFSFFTVSPNPFDGALHLSSEAKISYSIYNATGQLLEWDDSFEGKTAIGQMYSAGVYFLHVLFNEKTKTVRLVKK